MQTRPIHIAALILTVVGALNWGLIGLFRFDLVAAIFGGQDAAGSRIVYSLVGLAGLTLIFTSLALYGRTAGTSRSTAPYPAR